MRRFLALMVVTVSLVAGCQSPSAGFAFADPGRTTVLTTAPPDARAWYATRNDHRRSVIAGYELYRYSETTNRTFDRQHSHDGDVHDHYHALTTNRSGVKTVQ